MAFVTVNFHIIPIVKTRLRTHHNHFLVHFHVAIWSKTVHTIHGIGLSVIIRLIPIHRIDSHHIFKVLIRICIKRFKSLLDKRWVTIKIDGIGVVLELWYRILVYRKRGIYSSEYLIIIRIRKYELIRWSWYYSLFLDLFLPLNLIII